MSANTKLTIEQQHEAAARILQCRSSGVLMDDLPAQCKPHNLVDALAIRDLVFEGLNDEPAGWFVGCSNPAIQRQLGLDEPYCARLGASTVHASAARLAASRFPTITLEVEFAFTLGQALPARAAPYSTDEVAAAISQVHPAIEVVTSHFNGWTHQPIFNIIADNGTDGALVYGAGKSLAEAGDLSRIQTSICVNGAPGAQGSGADVLGDPLTVMVWLANRCHEDGIGLEAGQIHNTGSTTPMVLAQPGDSCRAVFEGLGEVEITFETQ